MLGRIFWIIGILNIFFATVTYSQGENNTTGNKDSINEIIVYEYDTVYLAPDTVRLTDTIFVKTLAKIKKRKAHIRLFSFLDSHSIFSPISPNSFNIRYAPYITNFKKNQIDSFEYDAVVNNSFFLQFNYNVKKSIFSYGFGFTPYHEKLSYKRTYFSSTYQQDKPELYDSLYINNSYTFHNYYNYLNFFLLYGRQMVSNAKITLAINIFCMSDILIGHNAYKPDGTIKLVSSEVQKIYVYAGLSAYLGYKLDRDIEFFISPYYQHSLLKTKKQPQNISLKAGLGAGFTIFL